MKTLDEVIKAFELCQEIACEKCPYSVNVAPHPYSHEDYRCSEGKDADALHYLKEYRSDMLMYAENQKYWEDELKQKIKDFGDAKERYIARLKELDIGTLNPPLTWDELKQMEGKPVWVEWDNQPFRSAWFVVGRFHSLFASDDYDAYVYLHGIVKGIESCKDNYGSYWQAYRKERSE